MQVDARQWPVWEGTFSNCAHYCASSKSLEGGRQRNGIECDLYAFYHYFKKVHIRNCSKKRKICKQGGNMYCSRYSY